MNEVNTEAWRPSVPGASPCVVHDGIETVSDGEDSTIVELCPDGGLNEVICF